MEIFQGICSVAIPLMYIHLWFTNRRLQKKYNELWRIMKCLGEAAEPTKEGRE